MNVYTSVIMEKAQAFHTADGVVMAVPVAEIMEHDQELQHLRALTGNPNCPGEWSGWISCEKRTPSDDGEVIVVVSGNPRKNIHLINAYEMARYDPDRGWVLKAYPEWEEADPVCWSRFEEGGVVCG